MNADYVTIPDTNSYQVVAEIYNGDMPRIGQFQYDTVNHKFQSNSNSSLKIKEGWTAKYRILYLEMYQKFAIISSKDRNIMACDIDKGKANYDWSEFITISDDIDIESRYTMYDAICIFQGKVIVILLIRKDPGSQDKTIEIWLCEVVCQKWQKCDEILIEDLEQWRFRFIKYQNFVHCIAINAKKHFALDLCEIIPNDIINQYTKEQEIIISGFIRNYQEITIPTDILTIINSFYASI